MAYTPTFNTPAAILAFVGKASGHHVVVQSMPPSISDPASEITHRLMCVVCQGYMNMSNYAVEAGGYNQWPIGAMEDFCIQHKHEVPEKEDAFPSTQGALKTYYDKKFVSALKANTQFYAPTMPTMYPGKVVPVEDQKDISMLGDIQVTTNGQTGLSVSQDILKAVARMSNFNVDLQAKKVGYASYQCRAICANCQEAVPFVYQDIISMRGEPWINLGMFCDKHKHDGVERQSSGRKFKEL